MKSFKMLIIAVFTAFIIVFSSCSGSSAESEKPVEITGLAFSQSVPIIYAEQFTIIIAVKLKRKGKEEKI